MLRRFIYSSESDYIPSVRYRLQCAMEKTPGIIQYKQQEFHVNIDGTFAGEHPEYESEILDLTITLLRQRHRREFKR